MTTRQYSSRSQQSTLTAAITSGATSMTVVSGTGILGGVTIPSGRTFTLVLDPDTALEEIVDATAVSTNTFTITRAIDGSSAQDHSAGAVVRHMAIGRDFRDANLHAEASAYYNDGSGTGHTMHGIGSGEGDVVGTAKTQTLTNKTLTAPTISDPVITGVIGGAGITFEGSTADAHETTLTVADPTQDNTITLPNTTGTVVIDSATQTLTNKTLTSPTISGSPVITGLSSAGMIASSATPKDYVDSILGSATAAATSAASAATSAASAATSASSASTSASNALTSANSASTSATAAATSATSAAASATAAATSATSASNSASAASTSATSADTSASSASTSASSALTSANSASTSASSALTSANSAATSASSAATSYDSFDDRYLGAKASPPSVDNDGNALLTGALYWNTTTNQMFVWSGSAWSEISSTAALYRYRYTAAGGETSLSGPDDNGVTLSYLVGKEQVYLNGVMLVRTQDYTASTGSSITALSALSASDVVEIITFSAFNVATTISNTIFDAKGDLLTASAADTPAILALGTNEQRLVVDTATTSGLKYVSDTTNYAVAAKGDLLAGSAADTVTALTVGSNGDTLIADSSASTGLRWQSVQSRNIVYNSAFDVWQRGTSIALTTTSYTADRWFGYGSVAGRTVSRQTGDTGFNYCARVQRDSGNTNTSAIYFGQPFEIIDCTKFAGKTITWSFYARAGANYSRSSSGLDVVMLTGTGNTDSNAIVAGYTGQTSAINQTATLTTSWQRFQYSATLPSNVTQFTIYYGFAPTGTAGANDWFEVSGVQLELGSVATPFVRSSGNIAGEFSAACRYYQKQVRQNGWILGNSNGTTIAYAAIPLQPEMRVAPTITLAAAGQTAGTLSFLTSAGGYPTTTGTHTVTSITVNGFQIDAAGYVGLTSNTIAPFFMNGANTVYTASAEL